MLAGEGVIKTFVTERLRNPLKYQFANCRVWGAEKDRHMTIFDLISASDKKLETRQTKALAYMLASEVGFRRLVVGRIVRYWSVRNPGLKLRGIDSSACCVDAELRLTDKHAKDNEKGGRVDILVSKADDWGVLIEGKSLANDNIRWPDVTKQVCRYKRVLCRKIRTVIPVALVFCPETKVHDGVLFVSWKDMLDWIDEYATRETARRCELFGEFRDFIKSIQTNMKYYQQEVLSIPAGATYNQVVKYGVYHCSSDNRMHEIPLFVAFRAARGVMTRLYRYEGFINEYYDARVIQSSKSLTPGQKKQVLAYMKDDVIWKRSGDAEIGKKTRFYVFDKKDAIEIGGVRPLKDRVQTWKYYSITDMFNPQEANGLRKA